MLFCLDEIVGRQKEGLACDEALGTRSEKAPPNSLPKNCRTIPRTMLGASSWAAWKIQYSSWGNRGRRNVGTDRDLLTDCSCFIFWFV